MSDNEKNFQLLWPTDALERVIECPVCGSTKSKLFHEGIIDNVFNVAPGSWSLKLCINCESAYLDPRPTIDSIGKAYLNYYTHTSVDGKLEYEKLNLMRKIRRKLVNGYVRWKFCSNAIPASYFGVLTAFLVPGMQRRIDREYRHLPRPRETAKKLLDIGSGNGDFLSLASSCGWDVVGVDPDLMAIEASNKNGFKVYHGGVDIFSEHKVMFDVITMNHVIEHLHDPSATIKKCYELLKPGGILWLETPNIKSNGSLKFGKNWRGIESPRHLILYNMDSLKILLTSSGFKKINELSGPSAVRSIFEASYLLVNGVSPYSNGTLSYKQKIEILIYRIKEIIFPSTQEVITLVAKKII